MQSIIKTAAAALGLASLVVVSFACSASAPAPSTPAPTTPDARAVGLRRLDALAVASTMSVIEPTAASSTLAATASGGSWTELGPKPLVTTPWGNVSGRVTSLAVDLAKDSSGNTVYVGTAFGGLWVTTNALAASPTYTPLTDSAQNLAIGAVALDSSTTPTTIYLGTGEADNGAQVVYGGVGVLKSADGGSTWTAATSADGGAHSLAGLAFSSIVVDPTNPAVLVAATTDSAYVNTNGETYYPGLYRSTDHGATWSTALNVVVNGASANGQAVTDLVYDAGRAVMLAAVAGVGFYASSDHGATWSPLATPFANGVAPSVSNFSYVKLAVRGSTYYAIIVGGQALSTPTSGTDTGLVQSTDGGNTWTPIAAPNISGGEAQLAFDLAVAAPPSSNALVVAGVDIFSTTAVDGSNTSWLPVGTNIHPDHHALVAISAQRWFIGTDGGLYTTGDAGNNSANLNTNLATIQFYSVSPDSAHAGTFIGGAQDNGVSKTTGGGRWTLIQTADGGYTAVNPAVSNQYFYERQGVNLERSDDGGSSSTQIIDVNGPHFESIPGASTTSLTSPSPGRHRGWRHRHPRGDDGGDGEGETADGFVKPFALVPPNYTQALYAINAVWRGPTNPSSINAGWAAISPAWSGNIVDVQIDPTNAAIIYALTDAWQLWKTTNGTASSPTWTNLFATPLSSTGTAVALVPGNPSTLYVTTQGYGHPHVYRTTDAGQTWASISGNLPDVPVNTIVVDPHQPANIYIGTDIGVFVATDGGNGGANEVWSRYGSGLPNVAVFQLKLSTDANPLLVAASFGRGAWSIPAIAPPPAPATLTPVADAYVRDGFYASSNFGSATALQVDQGTFSGMSRISYLKFDLSSVSTVSSATLRLYGSHAFSGAASDSAYAVASTTWSETGITWNNKPSLGTKQGVSATVTTTAQYVQWDVTAWVSAQKQAGASLVSLAVAMDAQNSNNDSFNSKEASSNRPQLVVQP